MTSWSPAAANIWVLCTVLETTLVRVVLLLSFVRSVCEYGNVIFMGASVTHLQKLDSVQQAAERMCQVTFPLLSSHRKASAIGLLCKLLDGQCRGLLQNFCSLLISVTHTYHLRHVTDDPLSLQVLKRFNSFYIFIRSFWGPYH